MRPALSLLLAPLCGCSAFADASDTAERNPQTACVARGVAYFESIGSYPALKEPPNTGRAAEEVAAERCKRSLESF